MAFQDKYTSRKLKRIARETQNVGINSGPYKFYNDSQLYLNDSLWPNLSSVLRETKNLV